MTRSRCFKTEDDVREDYTGPVLAIMFVVVVIVVAGILAG